jgi:hypothetical protein
MAPIDEALAECNSLACPVYSEIARKHSVNRSMLSKRHRGVHGSKEAQYSKLGLLSSEQEQTLVYYINKLTERGLPPTCVMVRNFAAEICKQLPGKNWVYRFVDRHSTILSSGFLKGAEIARQKADSVWELAQYFRKVY